MKNALKSSLTILSFISVLFVAGFFNFTGIKQAGRTKLLSEHSLNQNTEVNFPINLKRFPNTVLSCKNNTNQAQSVSLTFVSKNEGAATSIKIKKNNLVNKKFKNILLALGIKTQDGLLTIKKFGAVNCFLKKIGDITINEEDISNRIAYIQDVPALFNAKQKKTKSNNLLIYNAGTEDGTFKILSYLEDGTLDSENEVTVEALSSFSLKAKNNKPKTYHVTSDNVSFLAMVRKKISGKFYISKPLSTFKSSVFSPKEGVLVVSNVTSAPATIKYFVATNKGKKKYEGTEWILPFGQRKISLEGLSKLKNAKMEIDTISYYYPKICDKNEKCFKDESMKDMTVVVNYLSNRNSSPSPVFSTEEVLSYDLKYNNNKKVKTKLPIACKIDGVVKPYCNQDHNSNGIDDAEEIFHYFANPEVVDADGDGFSNQEEIENGTKPFHPFDFPGVPKDDTLDGMYQLARIIENHYKNDKNEGTGAKTTLKLSATNSAYSSVDKSFTDSILGNNSQIESIIDSLSYNDPHNLLQNVCNGLEICIKDSDYANKIAAYVEGCLNVMNQAVGNIAGNGCRYCKVDIKISKECSSGDLLIDEGEGLDGSNRSFYNTIESSVQLTSSSLDNHPLHTICHELGHAYFNEGDRYAEEDFKISSLYSASPYKTNCLTSYDMFILKIATIRQYMGKPISEILSMTRSCTTSDGKEGVKIGEYGECLEDWTRDGYNDNPRLYCPPDGQNLEDINFPEIKDLYEQMCYCNQKEKDGQKYCCENEDDIICGDDCCSSGCVNDRCLQPKCSKDEIEYTDDNGNINCCPVIRAKHEIDGSISCCAENELFCGGVCCSRESCLETADGNRCCPSDKPYACLNALGSTDGCCEVGCLEESDGSNKMCGCDSGWYPVKIQDISSDKFEYKGCCPDRHIYNKELNICEKCPEEATLDYEKFTCTCPDGKEAIRDGDVLSCCFGDSFRVYSRKKNRDECIKCPTYTIRSGNRCICPDGREAIQIDDKIECCAGDSISHYSLKTDEYECIKCPAGTIMRGDSCICSDGRIARYVDGQLICCKGDTFFQDGECIPCPNGGKYDPDSNQCICPDGRTATWTSEKLGCCDDDSIYQFIDPIYAKCIKCPDPTRMVDNNCICPDGRKLKISEFVDGVCCEGNSIDLYGKCVNCPDGATVDIDSNSCLCRDGREAVSFDGSLVCCDSESVLQSIAGGGKECVKCPEGTHVIDQECICPDGRAGFFVDDEFVCCDENSFKVYHSQTGYHCISCPYDSKANAENKCICSDGREAIGSVIPIMCCPEDSIIQKIDANLTLCIDCEIYNTKKKDNKCICADERAAIWLNGQMECCESNQISQILPGSEEYQCINCPLGTNTDVKKNECVCEGGVGCWKYDCDGKVDDCLGVAVCSEDEINRSGYNKDTDCVYYMNGDFYCCGS